MVHRAKVAMKVHYDKNIKINSTPSDIWTQVYQDWDSFFNIYTVDICIVDFLSVDYQSVEYYTVDRHPGGLTIPYETMQMDWGEGGLTLKVFLLVPNCRHFDSSTMR